MTLRHRLHKVIYVPLDDRPYNVKQVRLLAEMVDYELIMPPLELIGHFNQPGQCEELNQWLLAESKQGVDAAILSLDMLAYGGLVASRSPHVRTQLALQRLDSLAQLRQQMPEVPIYASSIIMRLSITAASETSVLHWGQLRRYSELAGLVRDLGKESHRQELEQLKHQIPPDLLGQYLACRERNHEVNLRALREVAQGNLDYLVLAQEDAAQHGLHRPEQENLLRTCEQLEVGDRVVIYPGADEVGGVLFTRFVHQHMEKTPQVYILPSNATQMRQVAEFEDRPFVDTLAANLTVIGARPTDNLRDADLVLAVNAPQRHPRTYYDDTEKQAGRAEKLQAFAQKIVALDHPGLAICDVAFANGAENLFVNSLLKAGLQPANLLAFAGWNTAGNTVGSALAQGTLRLISLQDKGAFDLANELIALSPMRYLELLTSLIASEKAHVGLLFHHLVDDWLYQAQVRPQVTEIAVNLLQASVFDLAASYPQAEAIVRDELTHAATDLWIEHFLGRQSVAIGSDENRSSLVLAELEETRVRLPWRRLFEVELEFDINVQLVAEA